MSDENNITPVKVKNFYATEWCSLCNKAKGATYTIVNASHSGEEGVQDLPEMCHCDWWRPGSTTINSSPTHWSASYNAVLQPPPANPTFSFNAYQLTEYDLQRIRQIVAEEVKNVLQAVKEGHAGE